MIESRWQLSKSSGGSGRFGSRTVKDSGDDMRRVAKDAYGVQYMRAVWWVEPKNHQVDGFRICDSKFRCGSDRNRRGHVAPS